MDGKDIKRILGGSLKDLRIAKGLSQEQLAELINVQTNSINRIELGINFVKSDTLADLANVLGVHPKDLFSGKPYSALEKNTDVIKDITLLLQNFSSEKLQEVYKILKAMDIK